MSATASPPSRWRRLGWIAGLPVLGLLWAGATIVTAPYIDDALRSEAAAVIRESTEPGSEPWLHVEIQGRDLVASGEVADADRRMSALEQLAALPGKRRLVDLTGAVEDASPFIWTATLAAPNRIELGGNHPVELQASSLDAAFKAALPTETSFVDRSRAARGAPPDFALAAAYALDALRGLKPGAVATLTDTVLSVEGEAIDPGAYDAVRTTLAAPPKSFSLGPAAVVAPAIGDFRFAVDRRSDGRVVLSGNVVSEAARAEIAAAAGTIAEGSGVEDRLQTARGLPSAIDPAVLAGFVLKLSGLIQDGSVRYERAALSVSGVAIDEQAVGEVKAMVDGGIPAGVAAGSVVLTARPVAPYKVRIAREGASVVLVGHLPNQTVRDDLLASLKPRFFHESIVDRTRTADGAPEGLGAALKALVTPLATLASGEIAIVDRQAGVTGESLYAESARRLAETIPAMLPRGWSAATSIKARGAADAYDPVTCSRLFSERTKDRPLRFALGSSELKPDFYPVLDAVAALAKACPTERVEIVGHIDPPGAAAPSPKPLPEFTSSVKPAAPRPAKDAAAKPPAVKAQALKAQAKPEPEKAVSKPPEPQPEPLPDLAQQRALAIADYLQKAGLAPDRVATMPATQPMSERQGIGLALRS